MLSSAIETQYIFVKFAHPLVEHVRVPVGDEDLHDHVDDGDSQPQDEGHEGVLDVQENVARYDYVGGVRGAQILFRLGEAVVKGYKKIVYK